MKKALLVVFSVLVAAGCAYNRPKLSERTTNPDGSVTERNLQVNTFAFWPATSQLEKQRATIGKTMSVGTSGLDQQSGGTNVVEALKAIDSILSKLPK